MIKKFNSVILIIATSILLACNSKTPDNDSVANYNEHNDTMQNKQLIDVDTKQEQTNIFSILKPGEHISLKKTYKDTLKFVSYNDNYDYLLLIAQKDGKAIEFIYKWDWQNNSNYQFKRGDLIEITWKIDTFWEAGECDSFYFKEKAIDAKFITKSNSEFFLWRENIFDEASQQEISQIIINETYCKSISKQEKAAIGYVATFIGNECNWDGDVNTDRSNLKCKVLSALNLGFQCSENHLGFLKSWFSKDENALKKLEVCRTMPETATIQTTFDEMEVQVDKTKKSITIIYKVTGMNIRESKTWSYTQTDVFKYDLNNIWLINSQKSKEM